MKTIGGILFAATLCSTMTYAQKPAVVSSNEAGWHHIGQTTANFKSENESIEVLGADEFSAIKLKVTDAPLHIERLQVFYESGDMEEINVRSNIKPDGETRVIKLKHADRDISKVAFTYKTSENAEGQKADVELYGLKTDQPAGADSYRDEKKELEKDTQDAKDDAKSKASNTADDVKKGAQKAGDKVSEGVNDAAAAIKDQKVKDKVGPGGETVYVDNSAKYYYIDNQGDKKYITELQLKDKTDNK